MQSAKQAAAELIDMGFSVVPGENGSEHPNRKGWKDTQFTSDDFDEDNNVFIKLEKKYVDFDLDWPEARYFATAILPKEDTPYFGRKYEENSHCGHILFETNLNRDVGDRYGRVKLPLSEEWDTEDDRIDEKHSINILELRSGPSLQVRAPGSLHGETQQRIEWHSERMKGAASDVEPNDLCNLAGLVAFLSVATRFYPTDDDERPEYCRLLSGLLDNRGYDVISVCDVAELAGDGAAQYRACGGETDISMEQLVGLMLVPAEVKDECIETFQLWLNGFSKGNEKKSKSKKKSKKDDDIDVSDHELGKQFVEKELKKNVKFVNELGCWFYWDGSVWKYDELNTLKAMSGNFTSSIAEELESASLKRHVKSIAKRENILKSAQVSPEIATRASQWDQDDYLLGTPDGTLDIRTGKLREASPRDFITKSARATPSDAADCPEFKKFMKRIFRDKPEVVSYMQRWSGLAMTGDVSEHKLLFFFGEGRNGKGVFMNTIKKALGDYGKHVSSNVFMESKNPEHATELANFKGMRLITASEVTPGKSWNVTRLKELTGGDTVSARYMHRDYMEFDPQMTIMIAGNYLPQLKGVDHAMRSRFVFVKFAQKIPEAEQDTKLEEKLEDEMPGILRWMADGYQEYLNIGLATPDIIKRESKEYMDNNDSFGTFLRHYLIADENAEMRSSDLNDAYKKFTEDEEITHPWSNKAVKTAMIEHGFNSTRKTSGIVFQGCRLRTSDDDRKEKAEESQNKLLKRSGISFDKADEEKPKEKPVNQSLQDRLNAKGKLVS